MQTHRSASGHYHINVTNLEAHKKFWADVPGGRAMKSGGIDVN
jgi:hypothetical protein